MAESEVRRLSRRFDAEIFSSVRMQDRHKAWMYDNDPTVRLVESQERPGWLLTEVRGSRYPILTPLAGVGENLREAVDNAMELNNG